MNRRESTGAAGTGQRDGIHPHRAMACRDKPDPQVSVESGEDRPDPPSGIDDRPPYPPCAAQMRQGSSPQAETVINSLRMGPVQGRDESFRPPKGVPVRIRSDETTAGARAAA